MPLREKSSSVAVYPRWRGEHSLMRQLKPYHTGLSPLARGTPIRDSDLFLITRFIPAGAGNTKPT